MKKYMPGFVPINFRNAGIILLIIGLLLIIGKIISYFTDWYPLHSISIYLGICLALVGLYLIFIVPKEEV